MEGREAESNADRSGQEEGGFVVEMLTGYWFPFLISEFSQIVYVLVRHAVIIIITWTA